MRKIIQIIIDSNDTMFCLTEDGQIYQRKIGINHIGNTAEHRTFWGLVLEENIFTYTTKIENFN
jgi:hypothetical protein